MSDATVRAAIRDYIDSASVTGVTKVYKAAPYWVDGREFKQFITDAWGAIVVVHLDQTMESRITLPAINGNKARHHKVGLVIIMQWVVPPGFDPLQDADDWTDALDQVIEDISTALRADPNLGAPDVIFQAAQDPDDIRISRDLPKYDEGVLHVWQLIEFDVTEILTA